MPHSSKACTIISVSEWSVRNAWPPDRSSSRADLGVVVDLAVEDAAARLPSSFAIGCIGLGVEVDDREPPKAEADCSVRCDPRLAPVRAAMVQHFPHARHVVLGGAEVAPAKGQHACDATHGRRC